MTHTQIAIIGSGPAGWTAALYAARAGLKPVVVAGSLAAGGALMNTTEVENFPGFPEGIMGPDLMDAMQAQAEKFGAQIIFENATAVKLDGDVKTIATETSGTITADAVILAMGSAFRRLDLPNEDTLSGRGVSWCATCDGFFFKDKDVLVIGGGDSALEEANFLTRFANKVYVVHRRDQLRASKVMAERATSNPKIEFLWNSQVAAIHGEKSLTSVTLRDTVTSQEREQEVQGMFIAIGHDPRSALVADSVALDTAGYVLVGDKLILGGHSEGPLAGTATSVNGVFAAGDLVDHSYRQAITAAGSGCAAALDAQHYLEARS